ncbi:unnamed protein product [Agarophyton chilense]
MGTLLSPLEALPQLEEIQCLPSEKISQALSALLPRIQYPHPKLTQCMLDLIQIHPHGAISHLPDILPNDASVIHDTVETLSEMLASDRTLLVPILATLASLPLSNSHRHQIRFTQQYALAVVDEKDLPAVLRSLVRTSGRRGLWSAKTLRDGLSRTLSIEILPVLSAALCDLCNPKHPVTKYILAHPRLAWLDMHVFASLLSRPSARRMQFALVRRAVASAMQYYYLDPTTALAFQGMPTAARRLLSILVSVCGVFPADIAALTAFALATLRACPTTTNSIVADLGRGDWRAQLVLEALIRHGVTVKPVSLSPQISVAAAMKTGEWHSLFVILRKSFLYGDGSERQKALETAHYIVLSASLDVVRVAISVMDESVPLSLADSAAIGFLHIAAVAIMRGLTDIKNILEKRILAQCPKGFLVFDSEQGSMVPNTIQIDIGLVWDQSLSAISSIVAAGSAIKLAMNPSYTVESISTNVLNTVVLVPVVCVTLYQAVDYDSIGLEAHLNQSKYNEVVSETIMGMNERDLAGAIASFGACMAALVGIINVSSSCTGIFESALQKRKSTCGMGLITNFLERLLEFDRMFHAMQFAHNLLQKQKLHPNGMKKTRRKRFEKDLELAESVRAGVMRSLKDPIYTSKPRNEPIIDFPLMTLESVICSLISTPDEVRVLNEGKDCASRSNKDIELVRIDKLLIRQLCCFLRGEPRESTSKAGVSFGLKKAEYDFSEFFAVLDDIGENPNAERLRFNDLFPNLDRDFYKSNIFMSNVSTELENEFVSEEMNGSTEHYSPCTQACTENRSPYVQASFESISSMDKRGFKKTNVADMIHSPIFAALLLDRATSYIMLAKKLRKASTTNRTNLPDIIILAGMLLCCLNEILRFVSGHKNYGSLDTGSCRANLVDVKRRMLVFFQVVGQNLLHNLGDPCLPELEQLKSDGSVSRETCKALNALAWLGQFSVDSIVSSKAVEAILIASEVGVVTKCFGRQVCFKCLTTVYECDGIVAWKEQDAHWFRKDSLTAWALKQRRSIDAESSLDLEVEAEPWVHLPVRHGRSNSFVENLRIQQYFTGMHVSSAIDEGCGWIRELSQALRGGVTSNIHLSVTNQNIQRPPKAHETHQRYVDCDILLDMLGFRTIVETLMNIASLALRVFEISESLSVDDSSSAHGNPIPSVCSALRLFAGLLNLHQRNREAVLQAKINNPEANDFVIDLEVDHIVMNNSITVLQVTRTRIEELLLWYSNPCVDVSQLPLATVDLIQGIVGLTTKVVKQTSDFADVVKKEYSVATEDGQQLISSKRTRKSPGYVKRKHRHMYHDRKVNLTKTFKLIPKLVSTSENALQSVKKLAKTIGLRATRSLMSFAPVAVENDCTLHFGVGLKPPDANIDDASKLDDNRIRAFVTAAKNPRQ